MKRIKQGVFTILTLIVLVGCTKSVEQQLVAEGGTWKGDGFGIATKLTFYKDGDVTLKESSRTYSGTYRYNEQEKKLTLDFPTIGKQILTNVSLEKGMLRAMYGKNEVSFEPEKNE